MAYPRHFLYEGSRKGSERLHGSCGDSFFLGVCSRRGYLSKPEMLRQYTDTGGGKIKYPPALSMPVRRDKFAHFRLLVRTEA